MSLPLHEPVILGADIRREFERLYIEAFGPGDVVFMTPYLLCQATVFEPMIKWTLQNRSKSPGIDDGDMFLCNDPGAEPCTRKTSRCLRPCSTTANCSAGPALRSTR